jgi:hypothetical protein
VGARLHPQEISKSASMEVRGAFDEGALPLQGLPLLQVSFFVEFSLFTAPALFSLRGSARWPLLSLHPVLPRVRP